MCSGSRKSKWESDVRCDPDVDNMGCGAYIVQKKDYDKALK
jgi:hypothetical protein